MAVEGPLADGDSAVVEGSGFVAGQPVTLFECAAAPIGIVDCDLDTTTTVSAGDDGSFSAEVPVYAVLRGWGRVGTDCRTEGACVIAANVGFDGKPPVVVPLAFDPEAPLQPDPTFTASATENLVDGQMVRFTGHGFTRTQGNLARAAGEEPVRIWYCQNADVVVCGRSPLVEVPVDESGSFSVDLPVSITYDDYYGSADCRLPDYGCYMLATRGRAQNESASVVRLDLQFDPDSPILPAPAGTLSASATTGLGDFQSVTVSGTGYNPTSPVRVQVCRADDLTICDLRNDETDVAAADGSFSTEITVWPSWLKWGWSDLIDCRVAPGCVLKATPHGSESPAAMLPLTFGPPSPSRGRYLDPVFTDVDMTADVVYRDTVDHFGNPVQLRMDIFRPRGDTATNRPVIMWMHGGFFVAGDKFTMHDDAIAAAKRGYVGIALQYRLYQGGNEGWRDSYRGSLDAYDDATAAVQWLQAHAAEYGINPSAIIAGGYSAGAVTALNLAYLPGQRGPGSPLIAAAVSRGGILYTPPTVGDPPTIAFQGSEDDVTTTETVEDICDLAAAVDVVCELVIYDGDGHTEGDLDDVMRRTTDFLAEHVLGPMGYFDA